MNSYEREELINDIYDSAKTGLKIRLNCTYPEGVDYGYAYEGDAGIDLRADADYTVWTNARQLVGTGLSIELPEGYAAFVMPRSGLAIKHGVTVLNSPGVIDSGYRGEIKVPLYNTDQYTPFEIRKGDRIAQLVIMPVVHAELNRVDGLDTTERGADGFGSTGVN